MKAAAGHGMLRRELQSAPYELFMLGLSAFVLVALAVEVALPLDPPTRAVLEVADTAICFAFFADFVRSLIRAESRAHYFFTWGWLDLLSSVPTLTVARWGRAARVVRIIRLLRGFRSLRNLSAFILARRAHATFAAVALLSLLLMVFGSIAILHLEPGTQGSNIRTPSDALWWAYVTVTTVGYGDRFPITAEGRLLAAVMMAGGIGLFGTFTGFVASWFVKAEGREGANAREEAVLAELRAIRAELRELKTDRSDVNNDSRV